MKKGTQSYEFFVVFCALVLLVAFLSSVVPYAHHAPSSPLAAHTHSNGVFHSHLELVCKTEPQTSLVLRIGEDTSVQIAISFFVLPERPLSLLDPPPEAAFSLS